MQKFDTPAPISTVLDIPAGRIQVIAADRADTTVQVLPADTANGRDVKVAEQTKVVYGDGVLRIESSAKNQFFGPSGSIEVTIQLPAGSRVAADRFQLPPELREAHWPAMGTRTPRWVATSAARS